MKNLSQTKTFATTNLSITLEGKKKIISKIHT